MFVSGTDEQSRGFSAILSELESFVGSLSPEAYLGRDAQQLVRQLIKAEKLCGSARLLMSRRITLDVATQDGERTPTDWMAGESGESTGRSRRDLETARKLESQPELEEALRAGEISPTQASILADAGAADPEAAAELLSDATSVSITELKDRARKIIAAKTAEEDAIQRELRIRARRHLRFTVSDEGSVLLRGELPATEGAAVRNLLQKRRDQIFREARSKEKPEFEAGEAYLADALVSVCQQAGELPSGRVATPRVPVAEIVLHVSVEALRRGELHPGESCVVQGVGPVPLATVEYLFGRSLATVVVEKGRDVVSITRAGRYFPPDLDKALRLRDLVCAVPGCGQRYGLERDHIIEVGQNGPTELENTVMLCSRHHRLKTMHLYTIERKPDRSWNWISLVPGQEVVADGDDFDVALPGEPTAGLARPDRLRRERRQRDEERLGESPAGGRAGGPPTDDRAGTPPGPPPGDPLRSVQQTFCCTRASVSARLLVPRAGPPPPPRRRHTAPQPAAA